MSVDQLTYNNNEIFEQILIRLELYIHFSYSFFEGKVTTYFKQSQVTNKCDSVIRKMLWMARAAKIWRIVS